MNAASADARDLQPPAWLDRAEAFAVKAMDAAGLEDWDLSLVVCGDVLMASLNREYRGKDGPTDVLSFDQGQWYETEEGRRFLAGDVVVCVDALYRNADEFSVPPDEELKRLIVHGILHLSGMDHQGLAPDEPMLARQEDILRQLSEETIL